MCFQDSNNDSSTEGGYEHLSEKVGVSKRPAALHRYWHSATKKWKNYELPYKQIERDIRQ